MPTDLGVGAVDVLVVGAGPVGLVLSCELARHGVRCRTVDKSEGTKSISKALILHVRTQEVLDAMGAIGRAKPRSVPLRRIQVHAYGKTIGHRDMTVPGSPHPHPAILGQDRTELSLEEHLIGLGGRVEWRAEAIGFEQDEHGVSATLRHVDGREESARARYLVGCEGSHSMTRKAAGLAFDGDRYSGEQFIQADANLRWGLPRGMSYLFLTDVGYMMVIEMPDDLVRVFISLPDPNPGDDSTPTLGEVESKLREPGGVADAELSDPTWLARYRTGHRRSPRFRNGRAFLAGDAGHIHVPIGGQGMNTGIQDAFNLGWKLAAVLGGRAHPALLDSYDAERVPVAEQLLAGTDKAYRLVLHPGELMKAAARRFGPFLMRSEAVQGRVVATLEELNIAYDRSPLTEDHGGSRGPEAGRRAPDAIAVDRATRSTVRLFDLIKGTRWTLLLLAGHDARPGTFDRLGGISAAISARFGRSVVSHLVLAEAGPAGAGPEGGTVLLDSERFLHDAYGASDACLYLIRPDGYVGFRGKAGDGERLLAYLGRILTS